jgi:uncharacterized protein YjdB
MRYPTLLEHDLSFKGRNRSKARRAEPEDIMRQIFLGLSALVMACSDSTGPSGSAPVASVTIQATTTSLIVGSSLPLTVVLRDGAGNVLANRTITFTTSNESVASVDATGVVQALAEGEVTITATSEGRSDQTTLSIRTATGDPCAGCWDY